VIHKHALAFFSLVSSLLLQAAPLSVQELQNISPEVAAMYDNSGYRVAIDGDVIVISSLQYNTPGFATVFERNATTGLFEEKGRLLANGMTVDDGVGVCVAVSGDTIVVGAPYRSTGGSLLVYEKPLSGWTTEYQTVALRPSDPVTYDGFGSSCDLNGDLLVVGSISSNGVHQSNTGAAYVFQKDAITGWTDAAQIAKLTASDGALPDNFGNAVAMDADTIVVGAKLDGTAGSAYLFEKPSGGWTNMNQTAKLTATDTGTYDYFGTSVAISGTTVLVGATGIPNQTNRGAAYLYVKPENGWADMTQTLELNASDGYNGDQFGCSVTLRGNIALIGAKMRSVGPDRHGSAYVFTPSAAGWSAASEALIIEASDGYTNDYFGNDVALYGETVVIGAPYDDVLAEGSQSGSAYVYKLSTPVDSGINPALLMYMLQ